MLFKLMATLTSFAIAAGSALIFGPTPHVPKIGAGATVHVPKHAATKVASLLSTVGSGPALARAQAPHMIQCISTTRNGQKKTIIVMMLTTNNGGEFDPWVQDPLTL